MMYMNLLAGKAGIYIILKIRCSLYQEKPLKMERFSFWMAGASLQCTHPVHRWGSASLRCQIPECDHFFAGCSMEQELDSKPVASTPKSIGQTGPTDFLSF